jgi:hypothetical protein
LGQFVKVLAHMAPGEGEPHLAALGQHLVAGIAVDLQDAAETGEMRDRPRCKFPGGDKIFEMICGSRDLYRVLGLGNGSLAVLATCVL